MAKQTSPVDWMERILADAIDSRASDIHLEPERESFNVRFRIDGILYTIESLTKYSQEKIISRIKVLSNVNITEHRLPQGGNFEFNYKDRIYNIRTSTLPTPNGEAIVLRILNREEILIRIQDLGFDKNQLETMNRLIISPHGMILTTGPSGSGKTTLLYSTLNELNKPDNNIIALEDPIEFQMPTIRQVQITEGSGLDFARAMRSVLRQDPDIIMVGEIRDPETAQMAFQAALTGILVFSTFHTLDVPGLVARLVEMGMPRSVVAQAIEGVVSSRLLRKICDSCKKPYQLSDYEKMILGDKSKGKKFQKGEGCKNCLNSGYFGRTGIFEVVHFDNEIRSSIISKEPYASLHKLLKEKGIKTLRESAIDKVFQGITTVEEIARVTGVPYEG